MVLLALCGLALHGKIRLRAALPGILLVAAVAIGVGNALSQEVVHIDLVGNANNPAVVVTQRDAAVVLFRGGASNQHAVERQLARRGVTTVEWMADLRLEPKTVCTLPAQEMCQMASLPVGTSRTVHSMVGKIELLRTRNGGVVRLTIGNRQFVTLQGSVQLAEPLSAQWLLASSAKPDAIRWEHILSKSDQYPWMPEGKTGPSALALRRHGGLRAE